MPEQENLIPTEDEIKKLPRWAQVAFAARCARRIFHLYKFDGMEQRCKDQLEQALTIAEQLAKYTPHNDPVELTASADAAYSAFIADADYEAHVAKAADAINVTKSVDAATDAASCAANIALGSNTTIDRTLVKTVTAVNAVAKNLFYNMHIRYDFELLLHLSQEQSWDDNTPVPPTVFGPLWRKDIGIPDDVKEMVEEDRCVDEELVFTIEVADDATEEEITEYANVLADKADSYNRALGGKGLHIANIELEGVVEEVVPA